MNDLSIVDARNKFCEIANADSEYNICDVLWSIALSNLPEIEKEDLAYRNPFDFKNSDFIPNPNPSWNEDGKIEYYKDAQMEELNGDKVMERASQDGEHIQIVHEQNDRIHERHYDNDNHLSKTVDSVSLPIAGIKLTRTILYEAPGFCESDPIPANAKFSVSKLPEE